MVAPSLAECRTETCTTVWLTALNWIAVPSHPLVPVLSAVQFIIGTSEFAPSVSSHQVAISHFPVQVSEGSWRPVEIDPGIVVNASHAKVVPLYVACRIVSSGAEPENSLPACTQTSVVPV